MNKFAKLRKKVRAAIVSLSNGSPTVFTAYNPKNQTASVLLPSGELKTLKIGGCAAQHVSRKDANKHILSCATIRPSFKKTFSAQEAAMLDEALGIEPVADNTYSFTLKVAVDSTDIRVVDLYKQAKSLGFPESGLATHYPGNPELERYTVSLLGANNQSSKSLLPKVKWWLEDHGIVAQSVRGRRNGRRYLAG